jgi:ABC-2 type transport system permease protein
MMTARPEAVRRGPGYWLGGYRAMLRFDLVNLRDSLVFFLLIQVLMGAGMAIIYGFYFDDLPPAAATYIATGAPTLAIIPVGMTLVPTIVAQYRWNDTYDFLWSLPVPRLMAAASNFTIFTVLSIPGFIVTLLVASWRYDLDLAVSWSIVPAVLLTSLMAVSVGWGAAHAIAEPRITNLLVNLTIFVALLFSPIAFPIENFPDWLAAVHRVFPFWAMAGVVRAALTDGLVADLGRHYAVLIAWTIGAWVLAAWVVGRRT